LHKSAVDGDRTAERKLLELLTVRFGALANLRLGNKQDAEEVVQDTLMVVGQKYKNVQSDTNFKAWAHKVYENRLLNHISARSRAGRHDSESNVEAYSAPDAINWQELKTQLIDCLSKIGMVNRRYARIINLQHQGYAANEIGQRLDITNANVYMVLSRARVMLKKCLKTGEVQ
jgi:RNA polymerase sigma factor (sigma-70 family)